ncbi:Uncharacterised protein [Klebsiella pneumoniae]|uniref:Uncharacterized protein n=1 Tax=Klebsiella pneumoniae TaxID=573 RepID=A0A4P0Y0Q5_KLEPN|nr:Uncharacterised protein [Klebsiella pneumoniae]
MTSRHSSSVWLRFRVIICERGIINVADPLVGDIHYPFEHVTRIFIDKVVLPEITDQRQQFIAVFRFPVKKLAE